MADANERRLYFARACLMGARERLATFRRLGCLNSNDRELHVRAEDDPETLRGALAGSIRWGANANFNRSLYSVLRDNADPQSDLRRALDALEVA